MRITRFKHRVTMAMTHTEFDLVRKMLDAVDHEKFAASLTTGERRSYGRRRSGHKPFLLVDYDKSRG